MTEPSDETQVDAQTEAEHDTAPEQATVAELQTELRKYDLYTVPGWLASLMFRGVYPDDRKRVIEAVLDAFDRTDELYTPGDEPDEPLRTTPSARWYAADAASALEQWMDDEDIRLARRHR